MPLVSVRYYSIVLAEVLPIHTVRRWLSVTLTAVCSSTLSGSVTMVNVASAVMSVETAMAVSADKMRYADIFMCAMTLSRLMLILS